MVWTIEAKVLPLVGISGHMYIDIFDDSGARVCQINGLGADRKTLQARDIGMPWDQLRAFVGDFVLADCRNATRDKHPHKGRVIFQGTEKEIVKAIETARKAGAHINQQNLPYRVLSLNSNSVFMHMIEAISAVVAIDQQAVKEACSVKKFLPGIKGKIKGQFNDAARKDTPSPSQPQPKPKGNGRNPEGPTAS